jgi:hypothetical protein
VDLDLNVDLDLDLDCDLDLDLDLDPDLDIYLMNPPHDISFSPSVVTTQDRRALSIPDQRLTFDVAVGGVGDVRLQRRRRRLETLPLLPDALLQPEPKGLTNLSKNSTCFRFPFFNKMF